MKSNRRRNYILILGLLVAICLMATGCSKQANDYYKSATEEYKNGNYEKAVSDYAKVIELKGERAEYYIDYGYCLIQLGRYEEAIGMFQTTIFEKENSIVRKNNKKAYRGIGIAYYRQKDYKNAYKSFDTAYHIRALNELDMDILSYMGRMKELLGEYEEALTLYHQVLDEQPENVEVLQSRANVYCQLERYEESLKDYTTALKLDSNNYELYFGCYFVKQQSGDETGANEVLSKALTLEAKTPKDKFQKAKVRYYQGNEEDTVAEFETAASEGYVEAYRFLGELSAKNKDYTSAISYFNQYEEKATVLDASFYNVYGYCKLKKKEFQKALELFQKGLQSAGSIQQKDLMKNEIVAYEKLGNFEEAVKCMEQYLVAYPEDKKAKRDYEFLLTRVDGKKALQDTSNTTSNSTASDKTDEKSKENGTSTSNETSTSPKEK